MVDLDCAEIAITSDITMVEDAAPLNAFVLDDIDDVGVVSEMAKGNKCVRCYRFLPEVGTILGHEMTCGRCADAVAEYMALLE